LKADITQVLAGEHQLTLPEAVRPVMLAAYRQATEAVNDDDFSARYLHLIEDYEARFAA
jgi:hypothetical protein